MKKGRLAPYIIVSFLIHTGFLIGAHQFLKLPAEELETIDLIPVEVVVLREESPAFRPRLTPDKKILTKKAIETKSQILKYAQSDRHTNDITEPAPKAGNNEPSMTVVTVPTLGVGAGVLEGEEAASRPMVSSSQMIPLYVSVVKPLPPAEPTPLAVKMPAVLVETKAEVSPTYPQTPSKVEVFLRRSQSAAELVLELQPIAMESNNAPHLNVDMVQTLGVIPATREGETVAGKPTILASQMPPLHLFPVYPSAPAESSQLEVKIPEVLVEAQVKLTPADSQTPEKVATPLPGSRPAAELVSETPPLATERHDEPHLTLNTNPKLRNVPRAPEAATIAGKPMILATQMSPLQLSPAEPSTPSMSSLLDVKMPALPIEAEAATIPASPHSPQKIETPLSNRRRSEDLAAERQPIPRESTYEPMLMVSTLQVQSQPNGAQVYVNGMLIGKTPLAWELPLGKHEVRLALPDYYDWDAQVELTERNKALPIFFRLLPVE